MIKRRWVQQDNVGFSALVVGVAMPAFAAAGCNRLSVKPRFRFDVFGDVLVAIQAELSLPGFRERLVAGIAVFFEFRVPLNDVAGHHQTLKHALCGRGHGEHGKRQQNAPGAGNQPPRMVPSAHRSQSPQ